MIDIKILRENPTLLEENLKNRGMNVDVRRILEIDAERLKQLRRAEELRALKNEASKKIGAADPETRKTLIAETKTFDAESDKVEKALAEAEAEVTVLLRQIPNLTRPDVKVGKSDAENYVIRAVGEPSKFDFTPKDHMELGEALDIIDTKRAGKVSGARFGFLKGAGALLEFAIIQYTIGTLIKEGFKPIVTPVLLNERTMSGMGYLDHARDEVYSIPADELFLAGTSEQAMGGMHADEVLKEEELPLRYVGFSTCFRREAGSYGKDVKGILRVHQFDKLEMFSYVPAEKSDAEHEFLLSMEEKLLQGLKLPYHVLGIVTGDLGDSAARKYDLETWIPSQNTYRETHSTSTCTDWQARRLNVRMKRTAGGTEYVHMLNGTAFALGRIIIAIMENYQRADGSIAIPEVLQPFMFGMTEIR